MQEGWECNKCHNVYSPNTPFCLYCWFKSQQESTIIKEPIISNLINNEKINNNINENTERPILDISDKTKNSLYKNKDLTLPTINIIIPVLNKEPIYPLANKWPDTKIYLSGIGGSKERAINRKFRIPYILDSIMDMPVQPSKLVRQYFDYIEKNNIKYMLDSGAFSYMNNPKRALNLQELLQKYCFYINEFDIHDFFELDLDVFMSIEDVENIRKKIYLETHKSPIIVYHVERGHDYWINMCKENDFVAIGGIASAKIKEGNIDYNLFSGLVDEAHSYGTKVHGLGCTSLVLLNSHTMFFDTVDSTSWNFTKRGCTAALNEHGQIVKINGTNFFSAVEGIENDLSIWATFSQNYYGGLREL